MKLHGKILFLTFHLNILATFSVEAMRNKKSRTGSDVSWLTRQEKSEIDPDDLVQVTEDGIFSTERSATVGPIIASLLNRKNVKIKPSIIPYKYIWIYQEQAAYLDEDQSLYKGLFTPNLSPCIGISIHATIEDSDGSSHNRIGLIHVDRETDLDQMATFIVSKFRSAGCINLHLVTRAKLSEDVKAYYNANSVNSNQKKFVNLVQQTIVDKAQRQDQKINIFSVMVGRTREKGDFLHTLGILPSGQVFLAKMYENEYRTAKEKKLHGEILKKPAVQQTFLKIFKTDDAYWGVKKRSALYNFSAYQPNDVKLYLWPRSTYLEVINGNKIQSDPKKLEHIYPDPEQTRKRRDYEDRPEHQQQALKRHKSSR